MPLKLKANVSLVSVPSDNPQQTRDFFSRLLGIDVIPTLEEGQSSFHTVISEDGIDLMIGPRRNPQETQTAYFHVDNLNETLKDVTGMGGKVLWGPQAISMSDAAFQAYQDVYRQEEPHGPHPTKELAQSVVVQEPGGAVVGLLQIAEHMQSHYKVGRFQKSIDDKQLSHLKRGMEAVQKRAAASHGGKP
jgi:predicted enzyme related to lactoylglutathione lyase